MENRILQELIEINEEARDPFLLQIEALKDFAKSKNVVNKIEAVIKFKQQEALGTYKFRQFKIFVENNIKEIVKRAGKNYLPRLIGEFMELQSKIDTLKQNIKSNKKSAFVEKLNNSQEQKIQTIHPNSLF